MVTTIEQIPAVDLSLQHAEIAEEVEHGWRQVLETTAFVSGPQVGEFERQYAEFCGVGHCIGVGSGTDALELALRAVGAGPGDECIVPTNSFIATAEAVVRAGARPVFVDCDPNTYLIDPEAALAAVTARTKAIIPVHLYGQPAPVGALVEACRAWGIALVEDAAQSQGAARHGTRAGALGDLAATSFYPGKNLGGYGDAGAVTTRSPQLAERVRLLSRHGSPRKYEHPVLGFNSRLDTLQAVVLTAKLARLQAWNTARQAAAAYYTELLAAIPGVITPTVLAGNEHVWHLYVIRVPDRDRVLTTLQQHGVGAGVHYPTPIHLTPAFADPRCGPGSCPAAEAVATEIVSLPIYPGISTDQQDRVAEVLLAAVR